MRFARNLHLTGSRFVNRCKMATPVTAVLACALIAAGTAVCSYSGFGEYWRLFGLVCSVLGAVGVIWLGWYSLRLVEAITSIAQKIADSGSAERIENEKLNVIRYPLSIVKELTGTITQQLDSYSEHTAELEKHLEDLQIHFRLSQRQKSNTEAIIYSIRDAVIVIDESDRLSMANNAAARIFNFDLNNAQHKPIDELICNDQEDQARRQFVDFLLQGRRSKVRGARHEIVLNISESTEAKTFDCIVSCVYDHSEQVCGIVAVLHDITREKELSQMKNDFVSHVSHELKTPLASINAYSEMLLDDEAADEQMRKEFCSVIQNQAKRLNRLIEDILNISRIESGLIKIEKQPLSLTILIEEQYQMIKSYAEEKNIEVIRQKPIVFDQVYADKDMLSQVIVNLLSNAVKYTKSLGKVEVETQVNEIEKTVRLSVTDTGVGIPEDEVAHVFDKFYRVGANKSQAKGTGLGLNLVKQIIEKVHDGSVFVESKVGVGSTFGFELPLAAAVASAAS